jgi:hypothetical protein
MLPLQRLDLSQAEFEDFCEKWAFQFYERTVTKSGFSGDYDQMWEDFFEIQPSDKFKYQYVTSLGTQITFTYNLDNYVNPGDNFYTFKLKQLVYDQVNHI